MAAGGPLTGGQQGRRPPRATAPADSCDRWPHRRLDLTRKPTIAEVTAEIERAGHAGVFQFNKKWEIIINALESAEAQASRP